MPRRKSTATETPAAAEEKKNRRNTELSARVCEFKSKGLVYRELRLSAAAAELVGEKGAIYDVREGKDGAITFKPRVES